MASNEIQNGLELVLAKACLLVGIDDPLTEATVVEIQSINRVDAGQWTSR